MKDKTENYNLGLKKGVYEVVVTNGKESVKLAYKNSLYFIYEDN